MGHKCIELVIPNECKTPTELTNMFYLIIVLDAINTFHTGRKFPISDFSNTYLTNSILNG